MAAVQQVFLADLGAEFGIGTDVANKITLRVSADAANVLTNGADSRPFLNGSVVVSGIALSGNDLVVTTADGATKNVDLSAYAVDISASGVTIDPTTFVMTVAQTNGGPDVTIDLSELKTVSVADTTTVTIAGNGNTTPLSAVVKVSGTPGNALTLTADGLFVSEADAGFLTGVNDTDSIDLSASGGSLSATLKLSATPGNVTLTPNPDGLSANRDAITMDVDVQNAFGVHQYYATSSASI